MTTWRAVWTARPGGAAGTYRAVVNDALRRGLESAAPDLPPFQAETRPMGLRPGVQLDDIAGLLDLLDGPATR